MHVDTTDVKYHINFRKYMWMSPSVNPGVISGKSGGVRKVPFPGKLIVIFWKHVFAYSAVISGKIKHIFWNLFFVVYIYIQHIHNISQRHNIY
jgi:hypothetical protein